MKMWAKVGLPRGSGDLLLLRAGCQEADLTSSFRAQSLPEETEVGEKLVALIGHDNSSTVWPQPNSKREGHNL
jgi:hypothetical protein